MTILGFIRHGVTDWNVQGRAQGLANVPLNYEGKQQAEALARRLQHEPWDVIYSSDLARAHETAEIIAHPLGLSVVLDPRLREKGCGQIEGTTIQERIERWGPGWDTEERGYEQIESIIDKGLSFASDMKKQHPDQRVLVVSHGVFIGITLKQLIPHEYEKLKSNLHNTSLTSLKLVNDRWECELFNCSKHLEVN